ncbi:hypothetical protein EJ08DRAFT_733209 [Tothia fuscella]|uniref:Uncharacterized protein n=1 Tax=Tothia fuscella TaxID=1048955 RepID=A0A9P4NUE1_9PEZI|nr:hypothetical protein EJ08DRAFT_733209 [Tothia fuscella]
MVMPYLTFYDKIRLRCCCSGLMEKSKAPDFCWKPDTAEDFVKETEWVRENCRVAKSLEYPPLMRINPFLSDRIWLLKTASKEIYWYKLATDGNTREKRSQFLHTICHSPWDSKGTKVTKLGKRHTIRNDLHLANHYHSFMPMAATWRPVRELRVSFSGKPSRVYTDGHHAESPVLYNPTSVTIGAVLIAVQKYLASTVEWEPKSLRVDEAEISRGGDWDYWLNFVRLRLVDGMSVVALLEYCEDERRYCSMLVKQK